MPVCCGLRPAARPEERSELPYGRTRSLFATSVLSSPTPEELHRFYGSASLYLYALPALGARSLGRLLGPHQFSDALQRLEARFAEVPGGTHAPLAGHEDVSDHTQQRALASLLFTHLSTSLSATLPRSSPQPQGDARAHPAE